MLRLNHAVLRLDALQDLTYLSLVNFKWLLAIENEKVLDINFHIIFEVSKFGHLN
jgi:hypothetical protein